MKKILMLIVTGLLLVGMAGCQSNEVEPTPEIIVYEGKADMTVYGLKEGEHVFNDITIENAVSTLKNTEAEKTAIYIGYPDCPWCVELVPVLNEVAKQEDMTINYLNTTTVMDEALLDELLQIMAPYLAVDTDGRPTLFVPDVLVFEKGNIIANHVGTVDGHNAYERKMTEDEVKQLVEALTASFNENLGYTPEVLPENPTKQLIHEAITDLKLKTGDVETLVEGILNDIGEISELEIESVKEIISEKVEKAVESLELTKEEIGGWIHNIANAIVTTNKK